MSSVQQLYPTDSSFTFGPGLFKKNETFSWRPDFENNPHLLIWGNSGAGKSHLLREIITFLHRSNKHIHLVDLHGDLETKNENLMLFGGQKVNYGINPFQFDNTSVHAGPKSQLNTIVSMYRSTYLPNMGGVQELILKQLCSDTYKMAGLKEDEPTTWMVDDIEARTPSLKDMLSLITDILNHFQEGSGIAAYLHNQGTHLERLQNENGQGHDLVDKQLKKILDDVKGHVCSQYLKQEVEGFQTNKALNQRINLEAYSSKKALSTLQSLSMYTNALVQCGLFDCRPPPVRAGVVNRYNLQYMDNEVRRFFVEALSYKIFRAAQTRGEYSKRGNFSRGRKVDSYIILDELQSIVPSNTNEKNLHSQTYNRIAAEARKYGLGIIVVTQSPSAFPTPMLSNITKRVGLKTNPNDVNDAKKKLGVVDNALFNHLQRPYTAIISNAKGGYDPVDIAR